MIKKYAQKHANVLYFVFRVFVGLLFLQHGLQKLFGIFTDRPPVELLSLMGAAGLIETVTGIAIAIGLFTRIVALIAGLEMISAYFIAHIKIGYVPIQNGGELALLYFAAFLVLLIYGAGKWNAEKLIFKKELA